MRFGRKNRRSGQRRVRGLQPLETRQLLSADLILSELMAANTGGLFDGDGVASDWIEIHNAGDALDDLAGWYLTDDPNNLTRWRFPAGRPDLTQLDADERIVLFASGKAVDDYVDPSSRLHTNFKLNNDGEFLALVRDDGVTVVSQYVPGFPVQFDDVSYGIAGQTAIDVPLVVEGDAARVLVPTDDSQGGEWTGGGDDTFDDSDGAGWFEMATPIGFDTMSLTTADATGPMTLTPINILNASFEDQKDTLQGVDGDGVVIGNDPGDWTNGVVPEWDDRYTLGADSGLLNPSLVVNAQDGDLVAYVNAAGWLAQDLEFADGTPLTAVAGETVSITFFARGDNGQEGSIRLSLRKAGNQPVATSWVANIPDNPDGYTQLTADLQISVNAPEAPIYLVFDLPTGGEVWLDNITGTAMRDTSRLETEMLGNNASALVRVPFDVGDVADWTGLELQMKYDDGFVAYLNGTEVARDNFTGAPAWNSAADAPRADELADTPVTFDLAGYLYLLEPNVTNILAIQGLNSAAADGDFLIVPELTATVRKDLRAYFTTPTPGEDNGVGVDYPQIVINEIHYNPAGSGDASEFVEIYNPSDRDIDISGWYFSDGFDFTFAPDTILSAGGYVVVAKDTAAFTARFGVGADGQWEVGDRLNNQGETIVLRDRFGGRIDEVDYKQGFPWPTTGGDVGRSIELVSPSLDNSLGGNWRPSMGTTGTPAITYLDDATPGVENSALAINAPPAMRKVAHSPRQPAGGQDVAITAKVTDLDGVAGVTLQYQLVDPGSYIGLADAAYQTNWTAVAMYDDGTGGDAVAGDDVYTAVLPAELQMHRRLVRYRITAVDTFGTSVTAPLPDDPQPNFAYFVYDGVPEWTGTDQPGTTAPVTYGTDVMNSLPIYQLISDETDVLASQYNGANDRVYRFEGTLVYDGEVYDHIRYRTRGQNSTYVVGKNKWKIKFNRGHYFQWRDDFGNPFEEQADTINFGSLAAPWAPPNFGMAGLDEAVSLRLWNMAGVPAANTATFQLRIIDDAVEADPANQYEGDLWGLYLALEEADGKFLDQHGMPDGNLFKMQSGATRLIHNGAGQPTDLSDVNGFTSATTGYNRTNPIQPVEWWRDNVNMDGYYSYRSVMEAVNHNDQRDRENSIYFRDPDTDKWSILPWDVDLLYEQFDRWGPDGTQNASPLEQIRKSLAHEEINIEFQNRARELQDLLLNGDQGRQVVWEYAGKVAAMAEVDGAIWNYNPRVTGAHRGAYWSVDEYTYTWGGATGQVRPALTCADGGVGCSDFDKMANYVAEFIAPGGFGGDQLAVLHADPAIPDTPTIFNGGDPAFPQNGVVLEASAFSDPQGSGTFAAMQWRIGEVTDAENAPAYDPAAPLIYEIDAVWDSGELAAFDDTVAVPGYDLQVGRAYRARVRMKDDTGRWSHWSDPLEFVVADPLPSDVSRYLRVSEIMYNPAAPAPTGPEAAFTDNDDFEFIELVNTSDAVTLDVSGVSLSDGIGFTFPEGTILPPGERILTVRNRAAFETRYDTAAMTVAGEYRNPIDGSNRLSNSGETIALTAVGGDVLMSFTYDDRAADGWPDAADGLGSSLEVVNTESGLSSSESWYASPEVGGSPGVAATTVVLGRSLFYDGSPFDTGGVAGDDAAVATDKTALMPGQTATSGNYSGYAGGITGIMADLANPADGLGIGPADFLFRVGNDGNAAAWPLPAATATVTVRPGDGRGGSDRVVVTWPTESIVNQWLQVTLLSNVATTGLADNDIFYFGNVVGEATPSRPAESLPTPPLVNAADVIAIRDNPRGSANPALIDDPFDVNRDRWVNAVDLILARDNATSPLTALRMISPQN